MHHHCRATQPRQCSLREDLPRHAPLQWSITRVQCNISVLLRKVKLPRFTTYTLTRTDQAHQSMSSNMSLTPSPAEGCNAFALQGFRAGEMSYSLISKDPFLNHTAWSHAFAEQPVPLPTKTQCEQVSKARGLLPTIVHCE